MATTIRFKRGLESNLLNPSTPLLSAEPAFTTDTIKFFIGGPDNTTKYEMGNRHVPFITTLVNKSSAYLPNITTPLTTDFVSITSYGNTFQGIVYTGSVTKWLALDQQAGSMLTLTLCAAKFFGKPLRPSQFPPPLKVMASAGPGIEELSFDTYGAGVVPNNYCKYINNILRTNNQFTVLSGTLGGVKGYSVTAKRCIFDDFYLEFEERLTNITITDTLPRGSRFRNRYLYSLQSVNSNTLEDSFGGDILSESGNITLAADDGINLYAPQNSNAGVFTNVFNRWKKFKSTI